MVTSMLEKAIEIEGLLRIIRDGNPLPETYKLLNAKTASLAMEATALALEEENRKKEEEAMPHESPMADFVMAAPAPAAATPQVDFTDSSEQNDQPVIIQNDMAANTTATATEHLDVDLDLAEEDDIILSFDDGPETMAPAEDTSVTAFDFKTTDEPAISAPDLEPAAPAEEDIIAVADDSSEPEKVAVAEESPEPRLKKPAEDISEKIAEKEESKPQMKLKSAFSLNDRFLYARELFNGNMKLFDSTLLFIEGMEDYSLVEDYFYSELEWNPENHNVANFMEILRPQFKE